MSQEPEPTTGPFDTFPDKPDNCPLCGADLRGPEIPEQDRWAYGGRKRFSRRIGVIEHDRVDRWLCPDCGGEFR